jgi:drug/metabolite transporter (DMT)-like permease
MVSKGEVVSVAGLVLLSLVDALGSLRFALLPVFRADALPYFARQAVPLWLFCGMCVAWGAVSGMPWPRGRRLGSAIGIGLGLFVVPAVLIRLASGWEQPLARAALLTLTPVFALVLEPYLGRRNGGVSKSGVSRGWLPWCLAAVAGAACIFPLQVPAGWQEGAAILLVVMAAGCIAAANCGAVRAAQEPASLDPEAQEPGWMEPGWMEPGRMEPDQLYLAGEGSFVFWAAISSGVAAAVFSVASLVGERGELGRGPDWSAGTAELIWCGLAEAPALGLLFWLMRRMTATRMTARFVLSPLIGLLTGLAIARPSLELRSWLGLALMAASAGFLMLAKEREDEPSGLSLQ